MAKRIFGRIRGDDQGQSVIEMALVIWLLLLLVAGIADFGRAFNNYIIVTNAAREGARFGSRFPSDAGGIQDAAIAEAAGSGITLTADNITIDCLDGTTLIACPPAGYDNSLTDYSIRVTVTYTFSTIMVGVIGVDTLTLRNFAEMVIFGVD